MPSEIKFTNFGIPYLVEFANISIRTPSLRNKNKKQALEKQKVKENKPKLPPPPVRCPTCGHLPPESHPPVVEKAKLKEKELPPRPGGLYIRFKSRSEDPNAPPKKISERRLIRLRMAISTAVTNAGMTTPTSADLNSPGESPETLTVSSPVKPSSTRNRELYKGTYGQVKEALREAGLIASPCDENGFENGKRFRKFFTAHPGHHY